MSFKIESSAFVPGGAIPSRYTCEGEDISPPLEWSGAPVATKTYALIVADPDAPDPAAPRMTWVHWVLYDIPVSARAFAEAIAPAALPPRTHQGLNDWKRSGYGGPCPPIGRHRYVFKLYALDTVLPMLAHPDKVALEKALTGHVLAEATLIGTYRKVR